MKSSWNVVRTGVALSACLGLLAACQDRGQFQSKTFSKAEVDAWKVKNSPPAPNPDSSTPTTTPVEGDPSKVTPVPGAPTKPGGVSTGAGGQAAATPESTAAVETPAVPTQAASPFQGSGAAIKNFAENGTVDRDKLIAQNRAELVESKEAAKLVKGIRVTALAKQDKLFLSVDAIVVVNNKVRFMYLKDAPLAYSQDGTVKSFSNPADGLVQIKETDTSEVVPQPEKFVKISAVCVDPSCGEFLLRFDFKIGEGIVPAVFLYKLVNGNYTKVDSNLGDAFKTWDEYMNATAEQTRPAAPAATTPAPNAPPAGNATAPAPTAAAPAASTDDAAAKAAAGAQAMADRDKAEDFSWMKPTAPGALPAAGTPAAPPAPAPTPATVTPAAPAPAAAAGPVNLRVAKPPVDTAAQLRQAAFGSALAPPAAAPVAPSGRPISNEVLTAQMRQSLMNIQIPVVAAQAQAAAPNTSMADRDKTENYDWTMKLAPAATPAPQATKSEQQAVIDIFQFGGT